MAREHLGATIDIHGGGQDLIFPHHENEIAQSRCAHGAPLARYWVHNGMIRVAKSKMAKSRGNILTIRELLERIPGEVLRLALLSARYRDPLEWSDELIASSRSRLDRLYRVLLDCEKQGVNIGSGTIGEPSPELVRALEDDLNTPAALGVLAAQARKLRSGAADPAAEAASLRAGGRLLGLLQEDPTKWFTVDTSVTLHAGLDFKAHGEASLGPLPAAEIEKRLTARARARDQGDYAAADRIRDELKDRGVILEDGPEGTTWRRTAL